MSENDLTYNLGGIRQLLVSAFSPEDLQRLCFDDPRFQPIVANFGTKYSLNEMIDEVVRYCQTAVLWEEFLASVRSVRPSQYARFESRLRTAGYAGSQPAILGMTTARPKTGTRMRGLVPALVGLAATIIVFLILVTNRYYQAAVTLGALALGIALWLAIYAAFVKTTPVTTNEERRLAAIRRLWATLGIVAVVAVIVPAIAVRPVRQFLVSTFAGTPTPAPIPEPVLEAAAPPPAVPPAAFITSTPAGTRTLTLLPPPTFIVSVTQEVGALASQSSPTPRPMPVPTRADPLSTAVVRIDSETLYSGTVSELSHLLVEDQVYGHLLIIVPRSILRKQASAVHVLVFPDATLLERTALALASDQAWDPSKGASGAASGQEKPDTEASAAGSESNWVYPVMIAELNGAGFEIKPSGPQRQAVVSGQVARWSWSIWTEWNGTHELVLSISTVSLPDGERTQDRLALGSIPIEIDVGTVSTEANALGAASPVTAVPTPTVAATPAPTPGGPVPYLSCITGFLVLAVLSSAIMVLSVRKYRSRQSAVRILEQRLRVELDQETRAQIRQKIASLLSVRWWQFWK